MEPLRVEKAPCPHCFGSGWKILERDGISSATRCACASVGRETRLEARANIPPLYRNASVDSLVMPSDGVRNDFVMPADNPTAERAARGVLTTVRSYVREFPGGPKPGLLFMGPSGTGKTHLAVAVLRSLIGRGFEGVFFDFQNLLDRIRSGYDSGSGTSDKEAYRTVLETDVVVLDDLGAHRVSEFVEDTITSIITFRCNHKKATIVTTNLLDPEAGDKRGTGLQEDIHSKFFLEERIGTRARSRLFEMCRMVRMPVAEDYRVRRK